MKKLIQRTWLIALTGCILFTSCDRTDDPGPQYGNVLLEFTNKAGSLPIVFNTQWYTNENGDSFTISKFNYYISNVKLLKDLAATTVPYIEAESYHLVQQSDPFTHNFTLATVPIETYRYISFTIGVDSLRNVSGAQAGALDPANGMFWTWSSGYIMMKMEGNSPKSTQPNQALIFHPGGFSGSNSVLRTITVPLPNDLVVNENTKHIHISADILALFKSPNIIDFATTSSVQMPGAEAKMLADNYAKMFTITAVE